VAAQPRRIAFLLWGAHAQAKAALIEARAPGRHLLLQANHPRRCPPAVRRCPSSAAAISPRWPRSCRAWTGAWRRRWAEFQKDRARTVANSKIAVL
jgi:hypothetical protein